MELNTDTVVPQFDRILVQVDVAETMTASGLHLPKAQDSKFRKGIVKAVGKGKRLDSGLFAGMSIEIGQEVVFGAYAGVEIDDKQGLVLIGEEEIYATIKPQDA